MKIDMELKPGDITLLKILSCVLIAVISIRLVILPGIDKRSDLKDEQEQVATLKENMENSINNLDTTKAKIVKQKKQLEEAIVPYNPLLENREIDELVTGIVLKHNLFPSALVISDPTLSGPTAYQSGTNATTSSSSDEQSDESATTDETMIQYVNTTLVSLTLSGSESDIYSFIDDLTKNYKGIQMRSFDMSTQTGISSDYKATSSNTCKCTLAIYTCGEIQDGGEN